ncbi:MAG: glycosyltransferase family 2 protein [Flavobacteriaceae bacterium]
MSLDKISILMPFKNTAEFLPECLDSVLEQNYINWELLAVDDHSSDQSRAILTSYAKEDERVTVVDNDGSGIIPALRTAYAISNGNLITRMDSDDLMAKTKLERMANRLVMARPGHVALGQVKYFSSTGISDGYARYEKWINDLTANGNNYNEIYKECVIPSPCWMVYRQDLDAVGAFTPNRYPEDYDLTFRFYQYRLRCIPCSQVLHMWRDYPTRTSRTSKHYAQNYFLDIKVHYFLKLDRNLHRPLVIWGAGAKGKTIAQLLLKNNVEFHWLCDNPKKIGKKIYGCELLPFTFMETLKNPQSIISVANTEAQKDIRHYLKGLGLDSADFFFFC